MEAKELRIGNYVKDHLGRVQKVSETRHNAYICYLSNGHKLKYKLNTTKPIPLTEEWLVKFGFIDRERLYISGYYNVLFVFEDDMSIGIYDNPNKEGQRYLVPNYEITEHLHQLQNLYFALTNEELTIK